MGVVKDADAFLSKACRLLGTTLMDGGLPLDAFLAEGKGKGAGEN